MITNREKNSKREMEVGGVGGGTRGEKKARKIIAYLKQQYIYIVYLSTHLCLSIRDEKPELDVFTLSWPDPHEYMC